MLVKREAPEYVWGADLQHLDDTAKSVYEKCLWDRFCPTSCGELEVGQKRSHRHFSYTLSGWIA